MGIGCDQSSVRSWLVQPIKESSSATGLCAGRGCALIRQLANAAAAAADDDDDEMNAAVSG